MGTQHVGKYWIRHRFESDPAFFKQVQTLFRERRMGYIRQLIDELVNQTEPALDETSRQILTKKVSDFIATGNASKELVRHAAFDELDIDHQLQELVTNTTRLKSLLDDALSIAETDTRETTARMVNMYQNLWLNTKARLAEIDKDANTEKDRFLVNDNWRQVKKDIFKRLMKDYKGRGEVYAGLCERLASIQAALLSLEDAGRIDSPLYRELTEQSVNIVTQIQRHTESTKVENLEIHVQEVGSSLLRIIEPLLSNQPILFDRIVNAIEGNVENIIDNRPLRLPERVA